MLIIKHHLLKYITIAACLICQNSAAQSPLVQVIHFIGDVTFNAAPVTCGQEIYQDDKFIVVGKRSYVSVVTCNGYAFDLTRGRHQIKKVVKRKTPTFTRFGHQAHTTLEVPSNIIEVLAPIGSGFLVSDTLTLIWKKINGIDQYKIRVTNFMDSVVMDTLTTGNLFSIPYRERFQDPGLIFQIESGQYRSKVFFVKPVNKVQHEGNLLDDTSCYNSLSFIDKELAQIALSEIHGLYLDHIRHLYRLYQFSQMTGTMVTQPYYLKKLKDHDFEKFMISPR